MSMFKNFSPVISNIKPLTTFVQYTIYIYDFKLLSVYTYCFTLPIITQNPRQVETIKPTNTEIYAHAHKCTSLHTNPHSHTHTRRGTLTCREFTLIQVEAV